MQTEIVKSTKKELEQIEVITSEQIVSLTVDEHVIANCVFKKVGGKFVLSVPHSNWRSRLGEVRFCLRNDLMEVKGRGFVCSQLEGSRCKIEIQELYSEDFNKTKEYFAKKFIPKVAGIRNDDFFYLERYTLDDSTVRRDLISVSWNGKTLHIYTVGKDEEEFVVIECTQAITQSEFDSLSWAFLVSYGYLTGVLIQDEEYNFYRENKTIESALSYEYGKLRPTIKTVYSPTNSRTYAWVRDVHEAEILYGTIPKISPEHLANLCSKVQESNQLQGLLLLVIEAMQRSLLMMPAGLSIALEGLADYFYDRNSERLNPIPAVHWKGIRMALLQTLSQTVNRSNADLAVLESKINSLNSPTNAAKLGSPFTLLGITLSDKEREAIQYRNDFLHGNITLSPNSGSTQKSYQMDLYEVSLRLYTLVSCIVLKMISYSGYVINYAKVQEEGMSKTFNEPSYRAV